MLSQLPCCRANHRLSMSARGWVVRQTSPTTALAVVTHMKAGCAHFPGNSLSSSRTTPLCRSNGGLPPAAPEFKDMKGVVGQPFHFADSNTSPHEHGTVNVCPHPNSRAVDVWTATCSNLILSGRRLDYIARVQLEFGENSGTFRLTLSENRLGLSEKNLITSGAARII